ncbi:cupin [Pseudovibrio japonicus]|uniref:Cupin n=1 Tax=Pseudovibrio japonicus TaxID=366534 RepID=A0ABQ3EAQ0_9HYPH|nr:cupin domain-containing protein [Pseudovibrio japonicus]GHB28799.1 cupin [Pseudovibrio japonicus]
MVEPTAADIIRELDMEPHAEGGNYYRTFRDTEGPEGRGNSSSIYYLLQKGEMSRWHKLDTPELWHFYAGAPLTLSISEGDVAPTDIILGADIMNGQRPQGLVPKGHWMSARSQGAWTLVGCTVAPGFTFDTWTLAEEGWVPGG